MKIKKQTQAADRSPGSEWKELPQIVRKLVREQTFLPENRSQQRSLEAGCGDAHPQPQRSGD